MLRVLVLSSRFPDRLRPNLGNFVEHQTLALAARPGIEVEVFAPIARAPFPFSLASPQAVDDLPRFEVWKGLSVHRPFFPQLRPFPALRPWALARRLIPLAAKLRERFPVDMISAEFSWPDGPAAIALGRSLGVPVVIKARGMEFERRVRRSSTRRQLIASGRAAQVLLAVSASMKQSMVAAGLPEERIAVHYCAVDTNLFRPGDRQAAKAKLGVTGPLLLAVGNLIPEKGHRLAVEALAMLNDATLIIAGSGPEQGALQARASELGVAGRLRMPGSVPHKLLPAFFTAADVTVHPSRIEGFAIVRLESLACGTPLVTTAVGEAGRVVDRPAAGRIVEPDASAIAAAIRDLLANPPDADEVRKSVPDLSLESQAAEFEGHLRMALQSWRASGTPV